MSALSSHSRRRNLHISGSTPSHSHHTHPHTPPRFEVADVEEGPPPESDHTPSGTGDLTHTSFGYNTTEAVPMTLYYRQSSGTGDMKPRPTLDHLREGRSEAVDSGGVEEVRVCVVCIDDDLLFVSRCRV